ncbi:MAG TPA: substrate-binding domain-containing protein [Anaeromyxobacter sp.]|nr:substrate-binding domain-containing protein [Anaeromyxobacter sp.]
MDVRIAVATHSLSSGFTGAMYALIRKHLRPGYAISECGIVLRDDPEHMRARLVKLLQGEPRPAALIGVCIQPDPQTIADFRAIGAPVVLIDEQAEGVSTVASDNFAGGYLAGRFLADAGRKSIAIVSGRLNVNGSYNAVQRMNGFTKALSERKLQFSNDHLVEVIEYSRKEGEAALPELLRKSRKPDAIFCAAGDFCASGLLAAARDRRLKIPDELAVLGYDDSPLAAISHPPLTTIRQPMDQIAAEAWRLATEDRERILVKPTRSLFPPEIVKRETV